VDPGRDTGAVPDHPAVPDFEAVRQGGLGVALYCIVPGEAVTLEIHAQGQVYTFQADTAEAAFALAFPPLPPKGIFD